jgi:hypothetical protein
VPGPAYQQHGGRSRGAGEGEAEDHADAGQLAQIRPADPGEVVVQHDQRGEGGERRRHRPRRGHADHPVLPGLALAALVRESRPRTAAFATVTTALGWTGSAGICSAGVFMGAMSVSPARDAQIQVLTDANKGASNVIFLLCVAGAVGMIALAVALAKSRAVPVGAAVLIGLGGAGTLLVMPGPVKLLLVLTALLLAAGQAWVLAATCSAPRVAVLDPVTR